MSMKTHIKLIFVLALLILLPGFFTQVEAQKNNTSGAKTQNNEASSAESQEKPEEKPADYSRPSLQYESGGKRDPFETLVPATVDEKEKIKGLFNYEESVLKGIVNADDDSYALVVDSDNFGYVLRKGYRVFGGYVTRITDDALYLHIVKYGRSMTIILRMESSKSTVIIEQEVGESSVKKPGININYSKETTSGSKVVIEEVIVPSVVIKTIEEEWFGNKETGGVQGESEAHEPTIEYAASFSLIDPPDKSWITVPYVLNWTSMKGKNISYILIIDDDSDFATPLYVKEGITTSSYVLGEDYEFPSNKDLFWKVIAQDGSGTVVTCLRTNLSFKIK